MISNNNPLKCSPTSGKRKFEAARDPNGIHKSAKLSRNKAAGRHPQPNLGISVTGHDGDDEPAWLDLPPGAAERDEYGSEPPMDDDEGRFFGGGITEQESYVLDYVGDHEEVSTLPDKINAAWLRKTAINFEKRITKNAEARVKFSDEPPRFIESEADLDAAIKDFSVLAEHPELYPQFVKLGLVESLVGLLAHDNTDIAIDVLEIIGELTDEDVYASDADWDLLADAFLRADLISLLVSNFSRLNEADETDRNGVYHALGIIENLISKIENAEKVCSDTELLNWLLGRAQRTETPVTQNKQYATELLDIIANASPVTRNELAKQDAADILLRLVSPYRKSDPEKGSEEEYMENVFNTLTCIVDEHQGNIKFVEAEGIELCLIMLREGKMSKQPALRLLVHSVSGDASGATCQRVVDTGGLKVLFSLFKKATQHRTIMESLLDMFQSLLRFLPADSAERIRTLAKFVEKDYEKLERLYALRPFYVSRLSAADKNIARERSRMGAPDAELSEGAWYLRRIEEGLYVVRAIDVVLAWLAVEDSGAKRRLRSLLAKDGFDLTAIEATLLDYRRDIDHDQHEQRDLTGMLTTLIDLIL
ncbi:Beta-catenin-like protein 1-like protein [Colletotrichum spinosum]|uniref:Beta-catenin-like protein 1-like protein n=1 Tax=Colletotrichum spinosum TaxID=1347390 RepID=A0A4R8Q2W2_9PEZI|nr:Beta-catenin-like protein 1-like protein [Colletotrichum spinosum]